ncbi:MAG: competence/damage-inducible protein A, partial [Phycisphaerae bacterium]
FVYNQGMTTPVGKQPESAMQRAWIISIGTELTLGQSVDTNAAWLAEQLAGQGIRCERHVTVPDDLTLIRDVLRQAADVCDLIVVTGGLGPTDDDLTREALAEAAGLPLETDAASLEQIRAFFARRGREMPEPNQVQARIPRGARPIVNSCGTAPGICAELNGTPCYVLPGVPFEMKAMFRHAVLPDVQAAAAGRILRGRRLQCFGMSESEISERLRDLMTPGRNPAVGTTAELGVISVRINACGHSARATDALLDETEAEVRSRLGEVVFGREADTLASAVGAHLAARGETLSTAESCTGGLIAKMLTDVAGSSAYFAGGVVAYANELKVHTLGVPPELLASVGAVSEPVARALAEGARRAFSTSYALAVTGTAGPTGGTPDKPVGLVFIGLATPSGVTAREAHFGSDAPRSVIRERAARTALNLLRLQLVR